MDVRTLIDSLARHRGAHTCLIWAPFEGLEKRWSYDALATAVRRLAAGLQARGVRAGDRVLVHLDNCPQGVIAWLGTAYAGAVPVTTNTKSTLDELTYFAEHSASVAAITQPGFAQLVIEAAPALRFCAVTDMGDGCGAGVGASGAEPLASIDADPSRLRDRPHDPRAPFGIQYTSGTTARPKAVLWTHANALWGARLCAQHEALRPDDVHLTYLPLFHTNAQVYSVLASLWVGATVVLMPRFSASRFWPTSLEYGATWTSMVPFCLRALRTQPVPESHFYRLWGNAICEPPTDAHFGIKTVGWWGMTETIAHGIVGGPHHPNAPRSMGRPSPGYAVHVVDDDDRPVEVGEEGNLLIGGEPGLSLFLKYADDPDATAKAFRSDGLFITGDRVRLGQDGFLYFADRSKDMLKVGGENVAASEVERVIAGVPGVAEVAVVGMPHSMLDEAPAAFVIAHDGQTNELVERIEQACETVLASFKRPLLIRLVDHLPRATLGKVAKAELRAILRAEH